MQLAYSDARTSTRANSAYWSATVQSVGLNVRTAARDVSPPSHRVRGAAVGASAGHYLGRTSMSTNCVVSSPVADPAGCRRLVPSLLFQSPSTWVPPVVWLGQSRAGTRPTAAVSMMVHASAGCLRSLRIPGCTPCSRRFCGALLLPCCRSAWPGDAMSAEMTRAWSICHCHRSHVLIIRPIVGFRLTYRSLICTAD